MPAVLLGELAALGTSLCWAFSSIFFTIGGRRVGSVIVNRGRLLAAVLLVGTAHVILLGRAFPVDAGLDRVAWFGLSALVGLVLGDSLLFQSYLLVGTRLGMLLLSLNPIFGALLAWPLLGETMRPAQAGVMLVALAGATWVMLEGGKQSGTSTHDARKFAVGVLLALGAALCQALGLIIAKRGLAGSYPALSALIIRLTVAMSAMWLAAVVQGEFRATFQRLSLDRRASVAILGGAVFGPFVGVWLSLVAVQNVEVGIASTLMAMTPIFLLPLVHFIYREKISPRAIVGTVIAVAGVAAMFFV